jgi:hypothetical protein
MSIVQDILKFINLTGEVPSLENFEIPDQSTCFDDSLITRLIVPEARTKYYVVTNCSMLEP